LVNSFAPYLLAKKLLPNIPKTGRIINLSSAAQNPIDFDALAGRKRLADMEAYAQSKLALTIWSRHMADDIGADGPLVVSLNPASLIGTKMVKDGFGIAGKDIRIGADILVEAAIGARFEGHSGEYFDNDAGRFGPPHPHAEDAGMIAKTMDAIETILPNLE
jgi:NAD(P)-dependent dehydrogenase (short-subunit alcohol dehydrogenase family)